MVWLRFYFVSDKSVGRSPAMAELLCAYAGTFNNETETVGVAEKGIDALPRWFAFV